MTDFTPHAVFVAYSFVITTRTLPSSSTSRLITALRFGRAGGSIVRTGTISMSSRDRMRFSCGSSTGSSAAY